MEGLVQVRVMLPLRPCELLPVIEERSSSEGGDKQGQRPPQPLSLFGLVPGIFVFPSLPVETKLGREVRASWWLPLREMMTATPDQIKV